MRNSAATFWCTSFAEQQERVHRHGRPGRPKVPRETRELIRTMSRENVIWGAPRIRSKLLKLGIRISEASVAKYMVRHHKPHPKPGEHSSIYGDEFRKQVEVLGIKEVLSAPRSPWQRAYIERIIGSIRRECLDHVIIFDEASLRRKLRLYFRYYHQSRLHLSLDSDSPNSRPVQSLGKVIAIPEVGGLHHRYERRAA